MVPQDKTDLEEDLDSMVRMCSGENLTSGPTSKVEKDYLLCWLQKLPECILNEIITRVTFKHKYVIGMGCVKATTLANQSHRGVLLYFRKDF